MARNGGIRHVSTSFKQFVPGHGRKLDARRACGCRPGAITAKRQPFSRYLSGDIDPSAAFAYTSSLSAARSQHGGAAASIGDRSAGTSGTEHSAPVTAAVAEHPVQRGSAETEHLGPDAW